MAVTPGRPAQNAHSIALFPHARHQFFQRIASLNLQLMHSPV